MKRHRQTRESPRTNHRGLRSRSKIHAASCRRGLYSLELVFVLPILGIVLMALLEFSMLFFARGEIVEASRIGARKASQPGTSAAAVEEEIRKVLEPRLQRDLRVEVSPGEHSGDLVSVSVRVGMQYAAPDLLWPIGYRLRGQDLHSETRMIRE